MRPQVIHNRQRRGAPQIERRQTRPPTAHNVHSRASKKGRFPSENKPLGVCILHKLELITNPRSFAPEPAGHCCKIGHKTPSLSG